MYLPDSYSVALLMLLVSMVCWGSWANTTKLAKGYRFELFYWDYMIGMVVMSLLYGLTVGSTGGIGFSFVQDLLESSRGTQMLTLLAGIVFGVANLLLVAAIAIAGLAVAFPVGIGLALIIGAAGNYLVNPKGNALLLFGGVGLVAVAIVLDALAYRALTAGQAARAAAAPEGAVGAATAAGTSASVSRTGLLLSVVCGVLMGTFYPFYAAASYRTGQSFSAGHGVGPYGGFFFFVLGAVICTLPLNGLYFMRKPISGPAVSFGDYFRAPSRGHLLGLLGGAIWGTGTLANFVVGAAGNFGKATAGPAVSYALGQGATMVSALWGVLVWKEFRGADARTRRLLALMFVFFIAGLALVAIAPRY
jgi:glucose uptake protein